METFLELIREILKGIVREVAAHVFRKNVLEDKKTTPPRGKQVPAAERKGLLLTNNKLYENSQMK
jgi:hypothetical protein